MSINVSAAQLNSRLQIVDEHMRAENAHDVEAIMATFSENPIFYLNADSFAGKESVRGMYEAFGFGGSGGFSNIRVEENYRHISNDAIILEATLTAEHTNAWQDIAATGNRIEVPLCAVFPFDDQNRLTGERVYLDGALLLKQLGVLP